MITSDARNIATPISNVSQNIVTHLSTKCDTPLLILRSYFLHLTNNMHAMRDNAGKTLSRSSFVPEGGWTQVATVQMPCALLHLSREANRSETAPPSVAAEPNRREPGRAHATEHPAQ